MIGRIETEADLRRFVEQERQRPDRQSVEVAQLRHDLEVLTRNMTPTGMEAPWGSSSQPGDGWLLEDGSTYSTDDFPELAAFLGASGSTFTVPNRAGRMPLGASGSYSLGSTGGTATETLTISQIPSHSHEIKWVLNSLTPNSGGGNRLTGFGGTLTANTEYAGGGGSHNNLPPYWATNWIIKT